MFLNNQSENSIELYKNFLSSLGAFSNLYSDSNKPYIHYRVAENLFCKAFDAENLARADGAYDAIKDGFGIGIKTFILTGDSKIEKVAEFNSYSQELHALSGMALASKLADYRNERILLADRLYDVEHRLYHIVGRVDNKIKVFEVGYELIDKNSIQIINQTKASLKFRDNLNEYNFNFSKSVLMKRFIVPENCLTIDVNILKDPIELLVDKLIAKPLTKSLPTRPPIHRQKTAITKRAMMVEEETQNDLFSVEAEEQVPGIDYVILPLYSPDKKANGKTPYVPEKSQLNQWNAGGRKRDFGEVYIPIPIKIHQLAPKFFPDRETTFILKVPDGEKLEAKVCQANGKALMTNPNNAMAEWILRKILNLEEGELLTYERLREIGMDSVKVTKINEKEFFIDFAKLDKYEEFINELEV